MIARTLVLSVASVAYFVSPLSHGFCLAQDQEATPSATEDASANPSGTSDAAPSEASDTTTPNEAKEASAKSDLRFGPSVSIGIPHPLTGAVDLVYADLVALSLSAGRAGTELDETDIEIRNWDIALRWFPFGGSFFLGAAFGEQGIVGKRTETLDVDAGGTTLKVPTTVRLEIESKYFTPQLGWFARFDSGLTLGFDIGVQLPSSAKSDLQTSFANVSAAGEAAVKASEEYKETEKDVKDAAELIGEKAIPYVNLIRVGWLF